MAIHKWSDVRKKLRERLTPAQIAENDAWVKNELLEMDLREMRELSGLTQVEAAKAAEITQAELSRAERREDHLVSTLRRYVKALGGELEVVARFGDRTIRLKGV